MSLIRPTKEISLNYAKRLAERWANGEITATPYYYNMARKSLNCFRNFLSQEHHSLLCGLIEFYNHHK